MSKLIILSGSSNSGKSEALINLANKIGILSSQQYPFSVSGDFKAICKKGNKTVAICTAGDSDAITRENMDYFDNNISDVYISAARTKGATVDKLTKWANSKKIDYLFLTKSWAENANNAVYSQINDKFADFLNSLI